MAKRGQGEGTICKRDDGRWVAAVQVGWKVGGDGKRRRERKYLYGRTRREVADKLTAALDEHRRGLPVALERQTVGQYLARWLADVAGPTVRASTFKSYESYVRLHIIPALGHHQLAKLAPQHVQALLNDRLAAGLSPRTVQYIRSILRRALGQALRWGLVARNVAALVDPPRSSRPQVRPLSPEQARSFLGAVKGDRLEALWSVAVALGLRQGEALGLRWEDIELKAGELRVRFAMQRVAGRPTFVEPKTERSRRTIALPAPIVAQLRAHAFRQKEEQLLAGARWRGHEWGLVFASTIGTPLDGANVTKRLQAHLARAGLPRQRFHDLRHCCASLLLAQRVAPRVVMEILGHSQIALTMDTYTHVMPTMQREAADLMDGILFAGA